MNDILDKLDREKLKIASFYKRVIAYFVDSFVLSFIVFVILFEQISAITDPQDIFSVFDENFILGFIVLQFCYHLIFTFLYGASLGKMLCKIVIIDEQSFGKPNFTQCIIRAAVRQLSDTAFMLGFAWALGNDLRKSWEDYLAQTLVIELA